MSKEYLEITEQLELFKKRGMIVENEEKALEKLVFINYYKLKEASLPFFFENKYIENTRFEDIVFRFYEDRNLRLYFMRIIEKIEISLKTNFSRILGREFQELGYLDFKKWTDSNEYCKHFIKYKEKEFLKRRNINISQSRNKLIKEYNDVNKIPIWLIVDILTFGEILDLYKLMKKEYQKEIADNHNITVSIFISWLENINLIRNLSAHNSNVLDILFRTKPKILNRWKDKILINPKNGKTVDKISKSILIMEHLTLSINKDFPGNAIKKCLLRLYKRNMRILKQIGFKDIENVKNLKI